MLTTDTTSVAIVAKQRELDRRELERQLIPLIASYEHTLLVLPTVSRHTREWFEEFAGQATAIGFRRDPRTVTLPQLPTFAASSSGSVTVQEGTMRKRVDRVAFHPHPRTPTICSDAARVAAGWHRC